MQYAELVQAVCHWTGITSRSDAERALTVTVAALGSCLPASDRDLWAAALPPELQSIWRSASFHSAQTAAQVYARLRASEGVPPSYAMEHAQGVIRVLAGPLDPDDRELLARHLPDELASLVREPRLSEGPAAHGGDAHGVF